MRCLFTHKWKTFVPRLWDTTFTSALAYRTCKRCGTTQFGMPKGPDQVIAWETMREHSFVKAHEIRTLRRPASRFGQLAHSLRLRRSRICDRRGSGKHTALTQS